MKFKNYLFALAFTVMPTLVSAQTQYTDPTTKFTYTLTEREPGALQKLVNEILNVKIDPTFLLSLVGVANPTPLITIDLGQYAKAIITGPATVSGTLTLPVTVDNATGNGTGAIEDIANSIGFTLPAAYYTAIALLENPGSIDDKSLIPLIPNTIPPLLALTSDDIPVGGIGDKAFSNDIGMTGIDLTHATYLTSIGNSSFSGCTGLKAVTIKVPSALTMGNGVFAGCQNIEYLDMGSDVFATMPQALSRLNSNSPFSGMSAHSLIYLPSGVSTSLIPAAGENENYIRLDATGSDQCQWFYVQDGCDYYVPYGFTTARATYNAAGTVAQTTASAVRQFTNTTGTPNGNFSSAYLPYPFMLPAGMTGYDVLSKGFGNADMPTVRFTSEAAGVPLAANTAYVVRIEDGTTSKGLPDAIGVYVPVTPININHGGTVDAIHNPNKDVADDDTWVFYGTTETIDNATAAGWGAYNLSADLWHPIMANTPTGYVAPMRCFLAPVNADVNAAKSMIFNLDGVNGTEGMEMTPGNSVETRVYNLNGQYLGTDINSLPKGVYIVNGKKVVKN